MPTLSLPFAEAVPILLPSYDQLDLVLIGCGGTGGWLAVNLPRIAYLQKQAGKKVSLTFIDPDRVEAKNIPRQNFIPSDLGLPKASVLAARYGWQWGIEINAIASRFKGDIDIKLDRINNTIANIEATASAKKPLTLSQNQKVIGIQKLQATV
jgi:tRNA A37 threonylcarbamoyladenosine dehydratase